MTTNNAFLQNTCCVVAWSREIDADGMLARIIVGVPLVLWSDQSGQVVALHDRCCHRAPMLAMRMDTALASFRVLLDDTMSSER